MQPAFTSSSQQQMRSVSYEITQDVNPQQNTFMSNFNNYTNFFGNSNKIKSNDNNKQSAFNESNDPSIDKQKESQPV